MPSFGRRTLDTGGRGVFACADPANARWKYGGVTIDWTTVTAVGSDTTLTYDGRVIKSGDKYIEGGTVLMKITTGGKFGPWLTGAADGRQLADATVRGDCYILDETVVLSEPQSDHPRVFDGGAVFKTRVVGKAGNPTEAQLEVMLPGITFVTD
jgi:hypothetical protein